MRIVKLTAENVKRLRAVEITPDGNTVVIAGRNGQGKQQPVTEPVLTPAGWRRMGEIQVGDHVIGSDGRPTEVTGVYPQTDRRVFTVRMADGTSTRCGADHLWTVQRWCGGELVTETLTTEALVARGLRVGSHRRWSVPLITGPVQFDDPGENLPIEPYTLGVILGDGHIEPSGYVTITSHDPEILDWVKVEGWRDPVTLGSGHWSRPLVHLGLAGRRSWEKFVPQAYLQASVDDRRALLQGLMDTDGTALESWASFTSTSEALADAVVDLANSLGWHAAKRDRGGRRYRYAGELREGRDAFAVMVKSDEPPFRLDRKSRRWKRAVQRPVPRRFIDAVEQVGDEDSVCIRVAAVDGLYVTNDWIVTHNTSVLDSIWFALGGGAATKGTTRPVRDGEDQASVTLDLGDLRVTRTWTGDKTALRVESADGATYKSPQSMLDGLVGRLSFDPLAFAQTDDKAQLATLLSLVDLPFDPEVLDGKRRGLYEERTSVGREVKALEGQMQALPKPAGHVPDSEVSAVQVIARLREAQDEQRRFVAVADAAETARRDVEHLREQLAAAEARLSGHLTELAAAPPVDEQAIAALEAQLAGVEDTNAKVRDAKARETVAGQLASAKAAYDGLTAEISALDDSKAAALRDATMPIAGLGFDDDGVTYQGVPFKQCSAAEQLRVSIAMAMAMNPTVRVIRITDGSLLDSTNLALIEEMAAAQDFQIWIERVDETGSVGVVIEDGLVVAQPVAVPA